MADDQPPPVTSSSSLGSYIDVAAKGAAVTVAMALLLGTTYNASFFAGSYAHWLLQLSVTDNIAATMLLLPFAFVMLVVWVIVVPLALRKYGTGEGIRLRALIIGSGISLVVAAAYFTVIWLLGGRLAEVMRFAMVAPVEIFALLIATGAAMLVIPYLVARIVGRHMLGASSDTTRLFILGAMFVVPLQLVAVIVARGDRAAIDFGLSPLIEIEISTKSVVTGRLVRPIDAGMIVSTSKGWELIPRSEIKRLTQTSGWDRHPGNVVIQSR